MAKLKDQLKAQAQKPTQKSVKVGAVMLSKAQMKAKAIAAIEKRGLLLVYPLQNRSEPASIWSELFPQTHMRWEWDSGGDTRVSDLWHTRAVLSSSRRVVYAKWFQNRATFFSREVFTWMLAFLRTDAGFSHDSHKIYGILEMDSPLSTKQIKEMSELQGQLFESTYDRAMKALWKRLWIVGFGEIEDSSFPSLAVGATCLLFEDLWEDSNKIDPEKAEALLLKKLGAENPFWKFAIKIKNDRQMR